ncbi:SAM-dependent DNA methyltransferase [Ramlibacter sp. WS9]|nr:SAM-dependent DNA methyltransferase [Ramlibacter sp. WS9]
MLDLNALARRLADRDHARTEANVQSDLHAFLLAAPLELDEDDLRDLDVVLEQQAGARRRIDVEAGLCVFEVKRDLRKGNVRSDAVDQLTGYVSSRTADMGQRYVGVLTDGAEWHLYYLLNDSLELVSTFLLDPAKPNVDALCVWMEGVLATAEKIKPTPHEINRRLGSTSPGYSLDATEIKSLYDKNKGLPGVKLKRELWARLLTTAFGTSFADTDDLFINHTFLVVTAEVVAHAVMGLDPTANDVSAATILYGHLFSAAQVEGVIDADFFDWLIEVEGGPSFVKSLARRLSRFAWKDVEHDVLKTLYESVISAAQRKKLGEYYTPDWLASQVVDATVGDPLNQRVLDPSCGSGTFLFHAIRKYLKAASDVGIDDNVALVGLTGHVIGMDIHPVAVTFARVTYLLAIGTARLSALDRPPLSIPVYLGDSIEWGQKQTLFTADAIVIPTTGSGELWGTDLRFPKSIVRNASQFDGLVRELSDLSADRERGSAVPSLTAVFRRHAIAADDLPVIAETFRTMCQLHDNGANHIWGYYARNLARPFWLALDQNQVDVLVGNPPWLSFRFMTQKMQEEFKTLSTERGLWAGSAVATNQDLSGLFVLRAIERYLPVGGRFGFVMPWATLRGRQFAGFRKGRYPLGEGLPLALSLENAWDLHKIKPTFFPVPASVISGQRAESNNPSALPTEVDVWEGRLPQVNLSWELAGPHLTQSAGTVIRAANSVAGEGSPYHPRFSEGATVSPRVLLMVEERPAGPMGAGAGRLAIRSLRSANEKKPWKLLPTLEGNVDRQFVRQMHAGDTVMPFRVLTPRRAIIPWDGDQCLNSSDRLAHYPGLADWWSRAEALWTENQSSDKLTLLERLDFQRGISNQMPIHADALRIVYTKSGMYLAAALIRDQAVIANSLYWASVGSIQEGRYLEAILNSDELTKRVRPLQSKGEHNPRHFDKYVWQVPIPLFDTKEAIHNRIADLGEQAALAVAKMELRTDIRFESVRRAIRQEIAASVFGKEIEVQVALLLGKVS